VPSALRRYVSPVRSQSPWKARRVVSARHQYPVATDSPDTYSAAGVSTSVTTEPSVSSRSCTA
jgi:hypothetical protein